MNRGLFFAAARGAPFGGKITVDQAKGLTALLDAFEATTPALEVRFQAYMLATTFHETARTMQPIEEIGKGRGRAYGAPAGPWHQVYDGRGDVQLTWERNYAHATQRLRALGVIGADVDLEKTPTLAMRPDIAAAIMIHGMIEGWFTGKKLGDFFNAKVDDPAGARTIINGHDEAEKIAGYHRAFLAALKAAAVDAPVSAGPVILPPKPPVAPAPAPTPIPAPLPPGPVPSPEPAPQAAPSLLELLVRLIAALFGGRR